MEYHSSVASAEEAGHRETGIEACRASSSVGMLEMPEDGSTTAVSGKGLSCRVKGLKVTY